MSNPLLNLRYLYASFPVPSRLIASSLLLGLLSPLTTPVNAQPSLAPSLAQAESAPTTNSVQTRLQGRWQVEDPVSKQKLTLIFTPDGKFFMLLPFSSDAPVALPLGYRINPTPQPMHMDVTLPEGNQTVMTIFEFTADGQLRLQLGETNPGQPRPTAFTPRAMLFQKVSEETTLPTEVQVLSDLVRQGDRVVSDLERKTNEAREAEGKLNIGAMNRAQQAFQLEYEKFGTTIEDLGIGIKPETENYRYQIVPQGNQRDSVMMTAQAKRPELRSYTGAVFVVKTNGDELITVTAICETDAPSSTPPAMPTAPKDATAGIQCATGSHRL